MMEIAFLVTRLEKPSARYRVLQYLPYLEGKGWRPTVFVIPKSFSERRRLFRKIRSFDMVFLQKKLLSRWDFSHLRKNARRLIYDLDDAVMFRDYRARRRNSLRRRRAFARTVRKVDRVIAGNRYLEGLSRAYSDKVSVLSTPIPVERYPVKDYGAAGEAVTLGWIGSTATVRYLEILREALETVARCFPQIRLKVVSDTFLPFQGIPVQKKRWNSGEEIRDLHSFDIGLMPLTDDVWSRGKCGFKILQYMAVGVPVVCSPVGMNREIIRDGVQGFWAEGTNAWMERLSELIQDPELRMRMGLEGRKRVEKEYSLAGHSRRLIEILRLI